MLFVEMHGWSTLLREEGAAAWATLTPPKTAPDGHLKVPMPPEFEFAFMIQYRDGSWSFEDDSRPALQPGETRVIQLEVVPSVDE